MMLQLLVLLGSSMKIAPCRGKCDFRPVSLREAEVSSCLIR